MTTEASEGASTYIRGKISKHPYELAKVIAEDGDTWHSDEYRLNDREGYAQFFQKSIKPLGRSGLTAAFFRGNVTETRTTVTQVATSTSRKRPFDHEHGTNIILKVTGETQGAVSTDIVPRHRQTKRERIAIIGGNITKELAAVAMVAMAIGGTGERMSKDEQQHEASILAAEHTHDLSGVDRY